LQHKSSNYLDKTSNVERVVDYIAGMTDRFFVRLVESFVIPKKIDI
jgi:dGTPase